MILYHGTYENAPFEIAPYSPGAIDFGGIFASPCRTAAESHGENVFSIEINEEDILSSYHLVYEVEYTKSLSALEKAFGRNLLEEEQDVLWDAVIEEKSVDEDALCEVLGVDDYAEASWECQRLRGQVARHLGFKAVEMQDEHGTSYLVLPGSELHFAD